MEYRKRYPIMKRDEIVKEIVLTLQALALITVSICITVGVIYYWSKILGIKIIKWMGLL